MTSLSHSDANQTQDSLIAVTLNEQYAADKSQIKQRVNKDSSLDWHEISWAGNTGTMPLGGDVSMNDAVNRALPFASFGQVQIQTPDAILNVMPRTAAPGSSTQYQPADSNWSGETSKQRNRYGTEMPSGPTKTSSDSSVVTEPLDKPGHQGLNFGAATQPDAAYRDQHTFPGDTESGSHRPVRNR